MLAIETIVKVGKRYIGILFLLTYLSNQSFGQTFKITGTVTTIDSLPLGNASLKLYAAGTNTLIKQIQTDEQGRFSFPDVTDSMILETSYIGFVTSYKVVNRGNDNIFVRLIPISQQLNTIVVRGNRPFMQQEFGKLVINVNGDSKAGIDATDVLRKIPGTVVFDQNVILEGQQVAIYIDGKPTLLKGRDLINMLKGVSTNMMGQIEVIYNPSSKYEAQGDGGIINITTIKRLEAGYNGSANFTLGHAWKYPLTNNSVNLSFRKGRFNSYGSYNISAGKSYQEVQTKRYISNSSIIDSSTYQTPYFSNNIRAGVDFYANRQIHGECSLQDI